MILQKELWMPFKFWTDIYASIQRTVIDVLLSDECITLRRADIVVWNFIYGESSC